MSKRSQVTVLGDGGWGTALALLNIRRGNDVMLWSAFPAYAAEMQSSRENKKYLPGIPLPPELQITSDLSQALKFSEVAILAIPTQFLRNVLTKIREYHEEHKVFVSVAKGIEKKTCLRPSEIIRSILGPQTAVVVLSGPSHAEEVARNIPTLVVAASEKIENARLIQNLFMETNFRVYTQTDIVGVELGGAVKNVIAIAAGVSDGLGYGANTKSGLLSRGLQEMTRLGVRYGANPNTFFGLSGLGDLMTTSFSEYGRNLRVGRQLGSGKKLKEILAGMEMVAEGVDSTQSVMELGQRVNVPLPIVTEVSKILFEDKDPRQAVLDLLTRAPTEELKIF